MFYNKSTQIGRGQDNRCNQPRPVGDILTEMFSSNSPLARGYRQHPTPSLASTSSSSHASLAAFPLATILTERSHAMPKTTSSSSRTPPTRSVMMCSSATHMFMRVSTSTSIASPTERSTLPSTDRSSTNSSHS